MLRKNDERKAMKCRIKFIKKICRTYGVRKFAVRFTGTIVVIVADKPDRLTKEVLTITEMWREEFGESVIMLINGCDYWCG